MWLLHQKNNVFKNGLILEVTYQKISILKNGINLVVTKKIGYLKTVNLWLNVKLP